MWILLLGCADFRDCDPVDASRVPDRLSSTGLYADIAADTVADGVRAFTPRSPLWSDGAEKQRWISLPGPIDTSDPDAWAFPVGTKAWKEFTRDGVRVETRMIEHRADGWVAVAYLWDGDDALAAPEGAPDAAGTPHDVPTAEECVACHGGRQSFLLGFSAVQLAGDALDQLAADALLTDRVDVREPSSDLDRSALGYLAANCSHCHNAEPGPNPAGCYDPGEALDWSLPAGLRSVDDAPAVVTGRDRLGTAEDSEVLHRMGLRERRFFATQMPPLATEVTDEDGMALLREWIATLP